MQNQQNLGPKRARKQENLKSKGRGEKRSSIRRWGGLPVAMRMASKKDHGLLKKIKSSSITSKNMVTEVGELSQSLQILIDVARAVG